MFSRQVLHMLFVCDFVTVADANPQQQQQQHLKRSLIDGSNVCDDRSFVRSVVISPELISDGAPAAHGARRRLIRTSRKLIGKTFDWPAGPGRGVELSKHLSAANDGRTIISKREGEGGRG